MSVNVKQHTYLALGDSMSIDEYTGVVGGGAVTQFFKRLKGVWDLKDSTFDGCTIPEVPRHLDGDIGKKPICALEVHNRNPEEWPEVAKAPWKDVLGDPVDVLLDVLSDSPVSWAKLQIRACSHGSWQVILPIVRRFWKM